MNETSWARTHCYHCGVDLDARTIELGDKLDNDTLTEAEMDELNAGDCANGCWAAEAAAQAALDAKKES